jgi:6-phosphogluconolactonase
MPSYLKGGVAVLALLAALVFAGSAAASASPVVGHVYVNDNTTGTNTVSGFDRHADGTLTAMAGSPFNAGGAGTGSGLASQGSIQVSNNGQYLLVADAASNQISVLGIGSDGTPTLLHVVGSDGNQPVSLAISDGLVYVANAGTGGSNYTGFILTQAGQLHPLAGSTYTLPDGAQPGDVLFNSIGTNLVGTRVGTSQIDSFRVRRDGLLTPAPGSPYAAQGPGPFGSEFRPTNPRQLVVSNAHGGANNGTVSAFRVTGDGTLFSMGTSPFPDHQTAPCWVEITHDGRFLFTVNTAAGTISSYSIAPDGRLVLLPGPTPSGGPSAGAVDERLSPDGRDLYVTESAAAVIGEFARSGGVLTPIGTVPIPTGAGSAGMATN